MPEALAFLCYAIALICFVLTAFSVPVPRVNLIGLGLAAWVLVPFVEAWPG